MSNPFTYAWPASEGALADIAATTVAAARRIAAEEEELIRNGLGQWVSEIDPVLIRNSGNGRALGIGFEGSGEVVIPFEGDANAPE